MENDVAKDVEKDADGPMDGAEHFVALLEGKLCMSVGIALILAAIIVPLATPFAVLLSTIGVIPLILASQHGITRSIIVTSLFPLLLVSGALDRRHSLDVQMHVPPDDAGDAPVAFVVRTDDVKLVTADWTKGLQVKRLGGADLGDVEVYWRTHVVAAVKRVPDSCFLDTLGTLPR